MENNININIYLYIYIYMATDSTDSTDSMGNTDIVFFDVKLTFNTPHREVNATNVCFMKPNGTFITNCNNLREFIFSYNDPFYNLIITKNSEIFPNIEEFGTYPELCDIKRSSVENSKPYKITTKTKRKLINITCRKHHYLNLNLPENFHRNENDSDSDSDDMAFGKRIQTKQRRRSKKRRRTKQRRTKQRRRKVA